MLAVKNLVKGLIEYVETGVFPFKPGILRDSKGEPILDIAAMLCQDNTEPSSAAPQTVKETASDLLRIASSKDFAMLDGILNSYGDLKFSLFSYPDGTAIMVPKIGHVAELPFAILTLARIADTGSGDSVAHRISKCELCGKFFLRKTKKHSRFHSRACRIKHMNKERLDSGWFRIYYARKKKEKMNAQL